MASEALHEPREQLSDEVLDVHRAIVSLMEELEAADWYKQRAQACKSPALKAILEHNGNEELEHASMILEWLRRNDTRLDGFLRRYLFTSGDITEIEDAAKKPRATSLEIGSLRRPREERWPPPKE